MDNLRSTNPKLEEAIRLLEERGWSVIPIGIDKKPLVEWKDFQSIKPTKEKVLDWFTQFPEANVGVVTGRISNLVVIDIDPKHGGTNKDFADIDTLVVRTGGGGWHYYFQYEEGLQNSTGIRPGIDIRGEGGYIIIPPSSHQSGDSYVWIGSPTRDALPHLPPFVKEWIRQRGVYNQSHWNSEILNGVNEGIRNESAASVAGKLLARFLREEWESDVWPLFQLWNDKNNPPLPYKELRTVFESIASREVTKKTEEIPVYSRSFLSTVPKLITELTESQARVEWIWEGYLAQGHLTFFSALWKVGKSTLISYLLKSLQGKEEFAGKPITATKVLILSEESETIWARRREDLGLDGEIYIHCRPTNVKLDSKQWLILLETELNFCTEKDINLFIIDTISTFWPVRDEGNNPDLDAALLPLNAFFKRNVCVMIVHHFRKSGGSEGTATRGGGGIGSRADILVEYSRLDAENPNDTQRVLRSYSRFEETPPELVIELVGDDFVPRGTRSEVSKEAKLQVVLKILQDQPNSTVNEILDNWDESKKPVPRTIRNYIEALLKDGRVMQTGTKLVGKTEAPSYSLNNAGKESNTYIGDSTDIPFDSSNEKAQGNKSKEVKEALWNDNSWLED